MKQHNYYIYIVTNPTKTVLYTGVTNDLELRLNQHFRNRGNPKNFAGKYYCHNLIYFEHHQDIRHAIAREKEIKGLNRTKKVALIERGNPQWKTLNKTWWSSLR